MKTIFTKKMMLAAIMMVIGAVNLMADNGDTFTTKTVEGVKMTFTITSESSKECFVGDTGNYNIACIDNSTTGTVTIPETAMGYTVVGIREKAFAECSVSQVVIPQTVRSIGSNAFNKCTNLIKCWLPESITVLSEKAFSECSSLSDVYLPHQLTKIEKSAFWKCKSLESVVIPASVQSIYERAFRECDELSKIVFLGENCPGMGEGAFSSAACSSATVYVPNRRNSDYDTKLPNVFFSTTNLEIKHGLENYSEEILDRSTMGYMVGIAITSYDLEWGYTCRYLGAKENVEDKTLTIPENVLNFRVIRLSSVGIMPNLETAVVPGTCITIGDITSYNSSFMGSGFYGCSKLKDVEIQEGVQKILGGAFAYTALKELRLPKTIKEYTTSAVYSCPSLTDVYLPVPNASINLYNIYTLIWNGSSYYEQFLYYFYSSSQATLHVPFSSAQNYESLIPEFAKIEEMEPQDGDIFAYPFKNGHDMLFQIISVADKTCRVYGQDLLTPSIDKETEGTVNIPAKPLEYTVVEVGDFAFTLCKKLSFVSIPNTVDRIGTWAMAGCDEMVSANIPASVKVIDGYAFQKCAKLVNVFLPEGLEKIMDHGFAFCPALETITLPQSLTHLGNYAFQGSVLTSIEIPAGVNRIDEYTFQDCKKLESVVLNEGLQVIDYRAFEGCESLTSIDLPRTVNKLYMQAFKNCLKLADVKIRNSHIALVDNWGTPVADNEAFDLKTDRYAELTVPKGAFEAYNQDPWFLWFNKISYTLEPTGISLPATPSSLPEVWYTLDGQQLPTAPTRPGLYIQNGKKTIVK